MRARNWGILAVVLVVLFAAQLWEARAETATSPDGAADMYIITFAAPPAKAADGYQRALLQAQGRAVQAMAQLVKRPLSPTYQYTRALNGMALPLTAEEAAQIGAMATVRHISLSQTLQPLTDSSPEWVGAPNLWDGSGNNGIGSMGEGIIIGILDTGMVLNHPSFAAVGGDGYTHTNPLAGYVGYCATDPGTFVCNDKLIGAWGWTETGGHNPEDYSGHGSNVAGIAAGNIITVPYAAPTITITPTLSGVAPHANIIDYDVCGGGAACPDTISIAAIEQAMIDGVDVINYSIGGAPIDPWQNPLALAFLSAKEAGIFVVTSVGNDGDAPETINAPANAPWMMSVGGITAHARFNNALLNLSGGATPPPTGLIGSSITASSIMTESEPLAPLVLASNYTNTVGNDSGQCTSAFPAGTWTGEIVYCATGVSSRTKKANYVMAGGAGGVIINGAQSFFQTIGMERFNLPGINLLTDDALALETWLGSGSGHMATIGGTVRAFDPAYGDEMYIGSSRGPALLAGNVLKPSLVAPAVKVWAAGPSSSTSGLSIFTGTSQASPQVAGAGALLMALHPDWSPAEIESALMLTAVSTAYEPDGSPADPFDQGSGRMELTAVSRTGLLLAETEANFIAADPAFGGDSANLNIASLMNGTCPQKCTWTRTFRNPLAVASSWTISVGLPITAVISVTPSTFTIQPDGTQTVTITAEANGLAPFVWDFGTIMLSEDNAIAPAVQLPLAVKMTDTALLTVAKNGTGNGTIISNSGLDCGISCTQILDLGTMVVLTAVISDSHTTFTGWSGEIITTTETITLTMDTAKAVTATFTLEQHELSLEFAGNGAGTVHFSPPDSNCTADCSQVYDYGEMVVLTAVSDTYSTFTGWSGDCIGLNCMLIMDAEYTVTAIFTRYYIFLPIIVN